MTSNPAGPTSEALDALARRAHGGDSDARNALWRELRPLVDAVLERQRGLPRLWDRDDLRQEAFLVFADLCAAWAGEPVRPHFERKFPAELARHVRRAWRKQARERSAPWGLDLDPDPEAERTYRLAELLEGLRRLPASHELALRLHLLWGLPLAHVGRQLGLGRRALGGLLPLARRAASGRVEGTDERAERLLRELYAFTDIAGRIRATGRQVRAGLGLTPTEHSGLLATLEDARVLTGRRPGHAGRLPADGPDAAVERLRRARRPRAS